MGRFAGCRNLRGRGGRVEIGCRPKGIGGIEATTTTLTCSRLPVSQSATLPTFRGPKTRQGRGTRVRDLRDPIQATLLFRNPTSTSTRRWTIWAQLILTLWRWDMRLFIQILLKIHHSLVHPKVQVWYPIWQRNWEFLEGMLVLPLTRELFQGQEVRGGRSDLLWKEKEIWWMTVPSLIKLWTPLSILVAYLNLYWGRRDNFWKLGSRKNKLSILLREKWEMWVRSCLTLKIWES